MVYKPTLTSSIEFAEAGRLEEWVHLFLCSDGDNKPFSDGLKIEPRRYHKPEMISLDTFKRACGPEDDMKWQIPEEYFYERANKIAAHYKNTDWDMPPLIVYRNEQTYELNDGNHRYEALKSLGIKKYWVIYWETVVGKT